MASSSHSAVVRSDAPSLAAYRDAQGNLPLVECRYCGNPMIGLVSRKEHSFGERFYKCPVFEHFFCWEEQYVEYLVKKSKLPPCFSKSGSAPMVSSLDLNEGREALKEAIEGVQSCTTLLESTTNNLKDAEAALKRTVDANQAFCSNIDKLGVWLLVLGAVNLFVVVLLLMVMLVK